MSGPLSGVRVIAFEQALAMPFGSFVLAEMGADVIKLERPGRGDVIRGWDSAVRGLSTGFVAVNANKRDVGVDLGRPEGREVVRRLVQGADVFLENFAPGVAARMGLADSDLRPGNPRLIYCSLSGYGQSGPYKDRKAYDLLVQGESGILASTGYPGAPAKVGIAIADLLAGTNAAMGVSMALFERERTGVGRYLDVSMLDSMLSWLAYYPQHHWHSGTEPPLSGMRHQYIVPYGPYKAAGGRYVNLAVASEEDWRRFCEAVVERPEWLSDPRFGSVAERTANRGDLEPALEDLLATQPVEFWEERLQRAGLAFGRVRGIAEVLEHPQVEARRMVVEAESPVGPLPLVRFALAEPEQARRVPGLGEHTEAVLGEAGYSAQEIVELRRSGVVV
jgi:crotonobetainyl-CoA:carnitine CoA-transferase CaiB-like acyl-CoA transferase